MISIKLEQHITSSKHKISETLLDHENLSRFFNAKFKLITKEGKGEIVGGKGAVRQVFIGRHSFNEQIICANDGHICYQIVGKGPVTKHQGDIYLITVNPSKTKILYEIQCQGPHFIPSFIVKYMIEKDIRKALVKLASYFK
jgi:hypothetical protein